MKKKIQFFPIIVSLVLIAASLAPWTASSQAINQAVDSKRMELQPAGNDTVSLETRKRMLAAGDAALMARRDAVLMARERQLNALSSDADSRVRKPENTRKTLIVAQEKHKKIQRERSGNNTNP